MKKIRKTINRILTTDQSDEEIGLAVGLSPYLVGRIRQLLLSKKCDWQKIKAMSDIELRALLIAKYPELAQRILPAIEHIRHQRQPRDMTLKLIWDEYCRASLYDA